MLDIRRTSKFKKDVKRMKKRGKNFDEFKEVITSIATNQTLDISKNIITLDILDDR